ncbi:MAG: SH3 domain-containing protein [Lachnospiraceae bacterium]|nr:SH3 domain-containing protein [Lachnospiraceae bacterium]
MSRRRRNRSGGVREILVSLLDFLSDNKKKVMPIVLILCVAVTIFIAIRANRAAEKQVTSDPGSTDGTTGISVAAEEAPLEQDVYPEINALIGRYFEAYVSGDVSILNDGIYRTLDEIETVTFEERAKYVDAMDNLTVYTKKGPVEDSWVVYAYTDVRYIGCDDYLPAMLSLYVCRDDKGEYYINADESSQSVKDYIKAVSLQADVVDLYNKVNVEYKEKLENDAMLKELVAAIYAEIDESVGERLAGAEEAIAQAALEAEQEKSDQEAQEVTGESTQTPAPPQEVKIRAITTVNVRSSDSTEASVLGKAREGEEYVRIAEQGNGWSKISFAGSAAYVKTEFFEVVTDGANDTQADAGTAAEGNEGQDTGTQNGGSLGSRTVSDGVRIRKSPSTEADIVTTLYNGAKVEVVANRPDGWSEVIYNGNTGYIKTEFLEND